MTRPRTPRRKYFEDFYRPVPLTVPCDRCNKHEAIDSTECFGCLQAARKVWPGAVALDSGRLSGT
jgi:hypothetical protein